MTKTSDAKKGRGRFSFKEDRRLIEMAAGSATVEEAAAMFRTSVGTIERKAEKLGLPLKGPAGHRRLSARRAELGSQAKKK